MNKAICFFFCFPLFLFGEREVTRAVAVLKPVQGYQVSGIVTFTEKKGGVLIEGVLDGLTPGLHGFHIHEKGECVPPDLSSAGGHYNPLGQIHAGVDAPKRHLGDLGNVEADSGGHAIYHYFDQNLSLNGPNSIVGRSLLIHEKPDDLTTQPAGASGARISCGIIQAEE